MTLIIFAVFISIIGYNGFTKALLDQYSNGAFRTARAAETVIEPSKMDQYAESGGTSRLYQDALTDLQDLCNSTGVTFIYVIRPDLDDYDHITFLFSTKNENTDYTCYDFGYYRKTTNDDYKAKYRRLYEQESEQALVIRDKGYIETDPHITAMIPLYDKDGKTTAILCVQRQMDNLVTARNLYLRNVLIGLLILLSVVILIHSFYLTRVCLTPVRVITEEASRFAEESTLSDHKLSETIRNKDGIGVLAASIDRMEEKIVKYVDDLTVFTAEKERISTELSLASKIQADQLPNTFPAFPDRTEFDMYATMTPAKKVGGDFYDFFLTDDDHLCLVISDISGKGIPAALFMMSSKIIISNFAKMGKSPAEILSAANEEIYESNNEDVFLTILARNLGDIHRKAESSQCRA